MSELQFYLERCPFCGGRGAPRTNEFDGAVYWWVRCDGCRCETRPCKNPIDAAVLWNMRNGKVGNADGSGRE